MKNLGKLRLTLAILVLLVAGSNIYAQTSNYTAAAGTYNTVPVSSAEATDTVAIGARMPYYVAPDADIDAAITAGFMNLSIFKWEFPASAGTPLKYNGTATAAQPEAGYFKENEVSVLWSTVGNYAVKVTEKSVPLTGTGCEDPSTTAVRNVVVQALPTFEFTGTVTGACGGASITTFSLPLKLSGSSPWKISYTITNGTLTRTVTDQVVGNGNMPYTGAITTIPLPVDLSPTFSAAMGTYTVTVTKVTDRITAKALNTLAGTITTSKDVFKIGLIATPKTSDIQHIKNL